MNAAVVRRMDLGDLDPWIVGLGLVLLAFGLVMVASASVYVSAQIDGSPWAIALRQALFALVGLGAAACILAVPLHVWERLSFLALLGAVALLAAVLVPHIGTRVYGSARWIRLGPLELQASDPALVLYGLYLSGYAVRRNEAIRAGWAGLLPPLIVAAVLAVLMLLEPDYGGTAVLVALTGAVLLVAGARWRDLVILGVVLLVSFLLLAVSAPYRVARLVAFLHPWKNALGSGFQLVESLMAIGHGGWWGVGLGRSVAKMFYLPEPESDFIFSVIGEELGGFGMLALIALYAALVVRSGWIALRSFAAGRDYAGYLTVAMASWFGCDAFINMGVSLGALPTKGLTLPLVSAGGSGLVTMLVALALVLRAALESSGPRREARP